MSLDDNISDDVFESIEEAEVNQNTKNLSITNSNYDKRPSSTGYRDYKLPSTTRKPSDPSLKIAHKVWILKSLYIFRFIYLSITVQNINIHMPKFLINLKGISLKNRI